MNTYWWHVRGCLMRVIIDNRGVLVECPPGFESWAGRTAKSLADVFRKAGQFHGYWNAKEEDEDEQVTDPAIISSAAAE